MKPEEQRIAIAEACGWKITQISVNEPNDDVTITPPGKELDAWRDAGIDVPDYLNDLNAMHEAEKVLNDKQQNQYAWLLVNAIDNHMTWKPDEFVTIDVWEMSLTEVWFACQATAAQRAEAFLRTLGKWKD